MKEKDTGKTKVHTIYKTKNGKRVPGTTTITGILNKPALMHWAWDLGIKGIDYKKFRDEKAIIGTLAHYMIEQHLKGLPPDLSDYTPNQISLAENAVLKFYEWEKQNDFKIIESEMKLVSEKHRFGGTIDIYCMLNGRHTLIDLKTSKAIYPEMYTQVVAYSQLLIENDYPVYNIRILRIGRDETEGFDDIAVPNIELHWKFFKKLIDIYYLQKKMK